MAERLNFKMHRESREMPVYALSIAKNGPRMQKAPTDPHADPKKPPEFKIQNINQEKRVHGKLSMTYLLHSPGNLDRPRVPIRKTLPCGPMPSHAHWASGTAAAT